MGMIMICQRVKLKGTIKVSVQEKKIMKNNLSTVRMLKNGKDAGIAAVTDKTLNIGCALFMNGSAVFLAYVKVVSVHDD